MIYINIHVHVCKLCVLKQTKSKAWVDMRNGCSAEAVEPFLIALFEMADPQPVIEYTLAAFILEARRADGAYYPESAIKNIPSALQMQFLYNGNNNLPERGF